MGQGTGDRRERLFELEIAAEQMLAGLDELQLHQAAAYVSMAVDAMRRADPVAPPTG